MARFCLLVGVVFVLAGAAGETAPRGLGSPARTAASVRGAPFALSVPQRTTLHAASLRPGGRRDSTDDTDGLEELAPTVAPGRGCTITAGCPVQIPLESTLSVGSPTPTATPFVGGGGGDPQVAVSKSWVVFANYDRFSVFGKSGKLATADANGMAITYPLTAAQFFAGPLHDVDSHLNLPQGTTCDPDHPDADGTYCLHFYDMRVVYDDFRNRFWLFAAGRNWRNKGIDDSVKTVAGGTALRAIGFVAVSVTDDPRGGWYVYTVGDVAGQVGACNDAGKDPGPPAPCKNDPGGYRPGDISDYPVLGISKDYFVESIAAANRNPYGKHEGSSKYFLINVLDANKLASGNCSTPCAWSYVRPQTELGNIQPVVQHDVVPGGWTLLTLLEGTDVVTVLGIRKSEAKPYPPLHESTVTVQPYIYPPADPAQPADAKVTKPHPLRIANMNGTILKAAERKGRVDMVWDVCQDWLSQGSCTSSIRLTELDPVAALTGTPQTPFPDRTFGFHNSFEEAKTDLIAYATPAVEVNADGNRVVVYNRVGGKSVFPEVRYSVWYHDENDIRPSALLTKGVGPCGASETDSKDTGGTCNFDTAGIAVDPYDGQAVWMAHDFSASSGDTGTATVGKVFGSTRADFQCWFDEPTPIAVQKQTATATFVVANTGDAAGKLAKAALYEQGQSQAIPQLVSSTASPISLEPGATVTLHLPAPAPPVGLWGFTVKLTAPAVAQYDTANDECSLAPVSLGQQGTHAAGFLSGSTGKGFGAYVVHQAFLGWGQGATFGSHFRVLFDSLGPIPMIHLGTTKALLPAAIADGKGDAYLVALNHAIALWGRAVYVRPLAEMNNPGNVWSGRPDAYRRAFARISLVVHGGPSVNARLRALGLPPVEGELATNSFPRVRVLWSPLAGGQPPAPYWPGAAYVDVAGGDIFDEHVGTAPWSKLEALHAFAVSQRKPFAVPEWGLFGIDDPAFVRRMCTFLADHHVETAEYFNGKPGSIFPLAKKPQSRAAYEACVGKHAGALPSWATTFR